jgi:hypothetical protein
LLHFKGGGLPTTSFANFDNIPQIGFVPILTSICACWHATNNEKKLPSLGQHHKKVREAKEKECDEEGTLFWTKHKRQEMQECSKVRKTP